MFFAEEIMCLILSASQPSRTVQNTDVHYTTVVISGTANIHLPIAAYFFPVDLHGENLAPNSAGLGT